MWGTLYPIKEPLKEKEVVMLAAKVQYDVYLSFILLDESVKEPDCAARKKKYPATPSTRLSNKMYVHSPVLLNVLLCYAVQCLEGANKVLQCERFSHDPY